MQSLRPHPNAKYRNIHHAFRSMMKKEGLFTPLRGMNVVALGAGPAHALYFSTYEAMKKFVNGNQTGYNPVSHGKCGTEKLMSNTFTDGTQDQATITLFFTLKFLVILANALPVISNRPIWVTRCSNLLWLSFFVCCISLIMWH